MHFLEDYSATNGRIYSMLELNHKFETTNIYVKFKFDWFTTTQVIEVTTAKNALSGRLLSNQWTNLLHV
jgi:hypothetical protein